MTRGCRTCGRDDGLRWGSKRRPKKSKVGSNVKAPGARICGLVQNSREASVIVTNGGRGVGSLVEERSPRFAIVHCLGITGPGQRKASAGGECRAANSGGG